MLLSKKRAVYVLLMLAMVLCLFAVMPRAVRAAHVTIDISTTDLGATIGGALQLTGNAAGEDAWSYNNTTKVLALSGLGGNYTLTGTNGSLAVVVDSAASGATVTLSGVDIIAPNSREALRINADCTVTLSGINTLTGSTHDAVAMGAQNISMTINGTGSLTAMAPVQYGIYLTQSASVSIIGNASVNCTGAMSGIMCAQNNTISVGSGAILSATGPVGIANSSGTLTLNASGAVSATGNTSNGMMNQAGATFNFGGTGTITVTGATGAFNTVDPIRMGDDATLTMTNNSAASETRTFEKVNAANTRNWLLTGDATLAAGMLTDQSIDVTIPANLTGTVAFEAAPLPFNPGGGTYSGGGTGKPKAPAVQATFPANATVNGKRMNVYKLETLKTTLFRLSYGDAIKVLGLANNGRSLRIESDGREGYIALKEIAVTFTTPIRATAFKKASAYSKLSNGNLKRIGYYDKGQTLLIYGMSGKYLINKQGSKTYYLNAEQWRLWLPAN